MSDEVSRLLPNTYRVQSGCHNCIFSATEFPGELHCQFDSRTEYLYRSSGPNVDGWGKCEEWKEKG